MTTTGYTDTFGRTVSGGLGTATSGQAYTLFGGAAAQYAVAPNTASITVNVTNSNFLGSVDRQTADIDISGQVALSAVPATNLSTVGFTGKQATNQNYYIGTMMVATGGAVSLRLSKVVSGGLVTLATVAVAGLPTYVGGTFYNLRFQCYWSNLLQANVLNVKLWALTAAEPGGWMLSTTDNAITQYASGTLAGLYARDEATSPGNIGRFQNVASRSFSLPMPAPADPMCADPAIAYPKQPVLESLAVAADKQIATYDPTVSLVGLYPRVRISASNVTSTGGDQTFTTTEFNIGTPTNLAYDAQALYLPVGIWLCLFEIELAYAPSFSGTVSTTDSNGPTAGEVTAGMRSNPAISLSNYGGSAHISALVYSTDPANPVRYPASFGLNSLVTYTVVYMALSAIKISDYFS